MVVNVCVITEKPILKRLNLIFFINLMVFYNLVPILRTIKYCIAFSSLLEILIHVWQPAKIWKYTPKLVLIAFFVTSSHGHFLRASMYALIKKAIQDMYVSNANFCFITYNLRILKKSYLGKNAKLQVHFSQK